MKRFHAFALCLVLAAGSKAQTFTMSNACTKMLQQIESYNNIKNYDSALAVLAGFDKKCTAKDAKWKGGTAKAHALNGLGKYSEAQAAATAALKANPRWISAYFERAVAYSGLGQTKEAQADYEQIIALSSKNQNTAGRASIFAMLGDIQQKQGLHDSAVFQIGEAIKLDPKPAYYIQMGDVYYSEKKFPEAFTWYDSARLKGKDDYEMASIVATQRMLQYQKQYGTDNVNTLGSKMSPGEKSLLCGDIKRLKSFGKKNMKVDMTYTLLCD